MFLGTPSDQARHTEILKEKIVECFDEICKELDEKSGGIDTACSTVEFYIDSPEERPPEAMTIEQMKAVSAAWRRLRDPREIFARAQQFAVETQPAALIIVNPAMAYMGVRSDVEPALNKLQQAVAPKDVDASLRTLHTVTNKGFSLEALHAVGMCRWAAVNAIRPVRIVRDDGMRVKVPRGMVDRFFTPSLNHVVGLVEYDEAMAARTMPLTHDKSFRIQLVPWWSIGDKEAN